MSFSTPVLMVSVSSAPVLGSSGKSLADMDWISNCATPLWIVVLPFSAEVMVICPAGIRLTMLLSSFAFSTISPASLTFASMVVTMPISRS